ncbi:ABC transporter ATP-binding protein [Atopobacter sp. AH10]|uniref:ATP-binding cassette domain-containing protein n=1 Tax=Atopobacter sp. AH10 TaxID=2315861 RepID=UPI000EF1F9BC|nr:ABC transporter ATP-binding protein [Atopobacter sp. AH10]RLK63934.1 ABC transporter ATP-binding protein [Atopobacter sp. AH10]
MINRVWSKPKYLLMSIVLVLASLDGVVIADLFKNLIELTHQANEKAFLALIEKILIVYALVGISNYVYNLMKYRFAFDANLFLKEKIVRHFLVQPFDPETQANIKKETLSFMLNDMKLLETNYLFPFFDFYLYISYATTAFIYSLLLDPVLALVFLAFSLVPSIVPMIFKKPLAKKTDHWTDCNQDYTERMNETVEGAEEIKEFHQEEVFLSRMMKTILGSEKAFLDLHNLQSLSLFSVGTISVLCCVLPLAIGGFWVIHQQASLANLVAVFFASDRIITPLKLSINIYNQFNSVKTIRGKLERIIKADEQLPEKEQAALQGILIKEGKMVLKDQLILQDINMELKPYDKVLVVGESGAGKSVLLNLIRGNLSLTDGEYKRQPEDANLLLGYQKDCVFKDSLNFNIFFSDKKIDEKLKNVFDIQDQFPHTIAYQGENISGGQAKRINLARLVNHGENLLLDEPFQGLSSKQSERIESYLLHQTHLLVLTSHILHEENLPLYSMFIVVENKKVHIYRDLATFKQSSYYQRNHLA